MLLALWSIFPPNIMLMFLAIPHQLSQFTYNTMLYWTFNFPPLVRTSNYRPGCVKTRIDCRLDQHFFHAFSLLIWKEQKNGNLIPVFLPPTAWSPQYWLLFSCCRLKNAARIPFSHFPFFWLENMSIPSFFLLSPKDALQFAFEFYTYLQTVQSFYQLRQRCVEMVCYIAFFPFSRYFIYL